MNVSIEINGKNATPYVVSYEREDKICTGKGLFHVVLSFDCLSTFSDSDLQPWRSIVLSEEGTVVKRYNINSMEKIIPTNSIEISAQDGSKRLEEYYISDPYTVTGAISTRYYMGLFLDAAGVTYTFTETGYGNLLPNDTVLGMMSTYDQMIQLLQLSAWYMYFDADNTCIIGKLKKDLSSPSATFNETDILTMHTHEDDKSLRNRAVIWGKGDSATGTWIYADVTKITPWNYDANDKRAIVYSSPYISSWGVAYQFANIFLDEYARLTFTKEASIHGARGVAIGDIVYLDTQIFSGSGLVTTCSVEMSADGLITKLILDERCPRLIGYYGFTDYVYVGLNNNGVWRKRIDEELPWENYSTGLADLCITDLYKNNGILSCVTASGLLYRRNEFANAWSQIPLTSMPITVSGEGEVLITEGLKARAVTQDRYKNIIHAVVDNREELNSREYGATLSGLLSRYANASDEYAWVVDVNPYTGAIADSNEIIVSMDDLLPVVPSGIVMPSGTAAGIDHILGFDIDNDGKNCYVSVLAMGESFGPKTPVWNGDQYDFGINNSQWYTDDGNVSLDGITERIISMFISGAATEFPTSVFTADNENNRSVVSAGGHYAYRIKATLGGGGNFTYTKQTVAFDGTEMLYCYGIEQISADTYMIFGSHDITVEGFGATECLFYLVDFSSLTYSIVGDTVPWSYTVGKFHYKETSRCGSKMYCSHNEYNDDFTINTFCIDMADIAEATWNPSIATFTITNTDANPKDLWYVNFFHYGDLYPLIKFAVNEPIMVWSGLHGHYLLVQDIWSMYTWNGMGFIKTIEARGTYFPGGIDPPVVMWQTETYGRQINTFLAVNAVDFYAGNYDDDTSMHQVVDCYPLDSFIATDYNEYVDINYPILNDTGYTNPYLIVGIEDTTIWPPPYTWILKNALTGTLYSTFDQTNYTIHVQYIHTDVRGYYMFTGYRVSDNHIGTIFYNSDGEVVQFIEHLGSIGTGWWPSAIMNSENWFFGLTWDQAAEDYEDMNPWKQEYMHYNYYRGGGYFYYIPNQNNVYCPPQQGGINAYCVLKETGDTYDVVYSGLYNYFRLDLSDSNPIVAITSGEWNMGFISTLPGNQVYESDSTDLEIINDMRYLTTTTSGQEFLYTKGTDLLSLNITDLSAIDYQNPGLVYNINSGILDRLETSKHLFVNPYIFVSLVGDGTSFFLQKDATTSGTFVDKTSGLPDDLINIIRLDDRV